MRVHLPVGLIVPDERATDQRGTDQIFFATWPEEPKGEVQDSTRPSVELAAQIDLDLEIARYQRLLESERALHSTELAKARRDADKRLDAELRAVQKQTEALHDSYRALLAKRQIAFDGAMSALAARHQAELDNERRRDESIVRSHRDRHEPPGAELA